MKKTALVMVACMAVLAGCAGAGEESTESDAGAPEAAPAQVADGAEEAAAPDRDRLAEADAAGPVGGGEQRALAPTLQPAALGDRIVRDGTMRVRVEDSGFDAAFNRLVGLADRFGGTVLASDATTGDDGSTSGTVTVRVPAQDFDDLLVAAGGIGEVERRSMTSEDVSGEFVDLEARLRHNRAQERFYLSLLDRADSVEDAIAVQQRVDAIQEMIEQLEGRLRFLDGRTSFSRLTVELVEAGATLHTATGQPSLARYWATARAALVNVLGGAIVVGAVVLPFAVVGAAVFVLGRRASLFGRRAATPEV